MKVTKRHIRHIEKAIDALIFVQDDGYGYDVANALEKLNSLLHTVEPLVGQDVA